MRFYRPSGQPLPLIVYVHDGAFIFGDLDPMTGRVAGWPWKPTPRYWRSTTGERPNIRHRQRLTTSSPH